MNTTGRAALYRLLVLLPVIFAMAGTKAARARAMELSQPETAAETGEVFIARDEDFELLNAGASKVLNAIDYSSDEDLEEFGVWYQEKYSLVMAKVNEYLNIREEPSADAKKLGYLYADCGGSILERGDGWTKIQSGNLIGWANNQYLYFAEEALALADEVGVYQATVQASGLNIRKEPSVSADIWGQVEDGEVYAAAADYTTDQWVAIEYGGALGYLSADYVTVEFVIDQGETFEEIEEREERERREKQKLIVQEGTSFIGTTDDMLLAALIQMEAGNQPYEGQVAVGAVVVNRMNSGAYPNTLAGVIYASGQFSPTVTGKVEELAVSGVKESCLQAARAALSGESPVGGATHFRRAGNQEGLVIGDHVFW